VPEPQSSEPKASQRRKAHQGNRRSCLRAKHGTKGRSRLARGCDLAALTIILLVFAGVALVLLSLWQWPAVPILLLVLVAMTPRYSMSVFGVNVNAERFALPCVSAALMIRTLASGRGVVRFGWAHVGLGLYLSSLAVSSLLVAPQRSQSLKLWVLVVIVSSSWWIVCQVVRTPRTLRFTYVAFLIAAVSEAVLGLTMILLNALTGLNFGLQADSLTGVLTPYASQYEGNTFGSFVAAGVVAWLAWLTMRPSGQRWRPWEVGVLLVLVAGDLASFSRGAWIATAAGVLLVAVIAGRIRRWLTVSIGLSAVGLAVILASGADGSRLSSGLVTRLASLPSILTGAGSPTRFDQSFTQQVILRDLISSPIVGTGAGSLGQRFHYVTQNLPAWNGNLELHVLNDAGAMGLLGIAILLLCTAVPLWRLLRKPRSDVDRQVATGSLAMIAVLIVAFQATEATYLSYSWLIFGLAWVAGHPRRATNLADTAAPCTQIVAP